MGNYFAQIAARNVVSDQPMLAPAHSPIEKALDDPFDRSGVDAIDTAQPRADSRSASTISSRMGKDVPGPVQPVQENITDATASPFIKPVYLSKYIERNQDSPGNAYYKGPTTPPPTVDGTGAALERKVALSPETIHPSVNTEGVQQAADQATIKPIQQGVIEGEASRQQPVILLQPTESIQEKVSLSPTLSSAQTAAAPVFLQPPAPMESPEPLQKEKPLPSLVIGKITVEIVPAQKPVNKIINQVIKSQPSPTATPRSKFGFGLGQL
ncbi:MAG: hypothetical protein J7621_19490 [Niastella sp.]|nr:hypothetical protein [Niastella sp.]